MKKLSLSILLILAFGAYVFYYKIFGNINGVAPVINNQQTSTLLQPTQTGQMVQNQSDNSSSVVQNVKPAPAPNPTPSPTPSSTPAVSQGKFKNGQYTGISADAFYGFVQVKAIISGGKLTDVQFLNYPQDRQHSLTLSNYALPQLKQEAIQVQSANVNGISGATATSDAFAQSLSSALSQAS